RLMRFFRLPLRPPSSTLFPYTTLFRSGTDPHPDPDPLPLSWARGFELRRLHHRDRVRACRPLLRRLGRWRAIAAAAGRLQHLQVLGLHRPLAGLPDGLAVDEEPAGRAVGAAGQALGRELGARGDGVEQPVAVGAHAEGDGLAVAALGPTGPARADAQLLLGELDR